MVLLNPVLSAEKALEWGLINQVVADEEVLPTALALAKKLAQGPTRSFGEAKRLILSGAIENLEAQMDRESRAIALLSAGADGQEGMAAFLAKRAPIFTGK
jgi:2-(1,2-epoxy-1,2-dihydrophenyl)acetyl-CoA isomerase